jgi:hypothetical protein
MKRKVYILLVLCISAGALFSSCEVDNYPAPDGTLTGILIDSTTNQGIINQQPGGCAITYAETSWGENPREESFTVKPDGTFRNTKIFAGTYSIRPGGPFRGVTAKTVEITSGGTTEVSFLVTPYISLTNVSIVKEGNAIKATFRMTRNITTAAPRNYRVFATSLTPRVGTVAGTFEPTASSGEINMTTADFGVDKTVTVNGTYVAGRTYYVRIGASCSGTSGNSTGYNLSQVFELKF